MFLTDEQCLRAACMAAIEDDAPWGAYSDWLREHGRDLDADRLVDVRRVLRRFEYLVMGDAEYIGARISDSELLRMASERFIPRALPIAEHADE